MFWVTLDKTRLCCDHFPLPFAAACHLLGQVAGANVGPMPRVMLRYLGRDVQQRKVELSPSIHSPIPALIPYTALIYSLLQPNHFTAGKQSLEVFI